MLQKLQSWLIRHRDQSAVSYSRFGCPGEEEDDKPPPSIIIVAPFNENSTEYFLFGSCHVQKAAIYFAAFGMSITILMFISTFFEFDWYHHKRGVDVGAVIGLFLYLAIGVLIHYYVIIGVKKQLSRYLLPFICVYSIVCITEVCMCIGLLFKLLDSQVAETHHHVHIQMDGYYYSTTTTPPYAAILFGLFIVLAVQFLMLVGVLRCRQFLSAKQEHEMAMKVAEMSKTQYPSIQIVLASSVGGTGPFRNLTTISHQNGNIVNSPTSSTANNSSPIPQTPFHDKNAESSNITNSSPTSSKTYPIPPTPSQNNLNKSNSFSPPMENIII
ncbi:hypothetical protein ACQ4LE_002717 [Meloidogyne hapla]|uniref:MARVEL domain-containing protein n=1 Tax=Meloidogyne hapla TaxID=6305 RepID=A0A1I8BR87_MELHA